jgi:hypothetical protein
MLNKAGKIKNLECIQIITFVIPYMRAYARPVKIHCIKIPAWYLATRCEIIQRMCELTSGVKTETVYLNAKCNKIHIL